MDISKLMGEPLAVTTTGSGRPYIDIGKHPVTGAALKCNVSLHKLLIADKVLGLTPGFALILRFAETMSPAAPSFKLTVRPGEQAQNVDDAVSLYRYMPAGWPVSLIGPFAYMIRRWNDQHVTDFAREYIKTTVANAGAVLTIDDAALTSMLTSWQDEHPAADPDYFTEAFGIPPTNAA